MLNPVYSDDVLMHHGVKGMKWGVRRYQNPDGSLTELGRKRLAKSIQSLGNKNEDSFAIAEKANKKLNLSKHLIIPKEKKEAITKALDAWAEKDEELMVLREDIIAKSSSKVDADMRKAGLDPDDRHRGYWEEDYIEKDPKYKALSKEVDSLYNKVLSMEKEVCDSIIGEYGNEPVDSNAYYKPSVARIIQDALFYSEEV